MLSATLLVPFAPSGADVSGQVSSLQAQAAQLSRQMVLEQLQIGGYQQRYAADVQQAAADKSLLAETSQRIAAAQARLQRDTAQLAHAAISEYVHSGSSNSTDVLFVGQSQAADRAVYAKMLTGNLAAAIDEVRTAKKALAVQRSAQASLVTQDQAAQAQAATLLAQAQATQQQLASQRAAVTGQLAVAVAQQQAQQAAAAATALAADRRIPAPSAGGRPVPSLPPFLRCVIQAESGGDYQIVSPTGQYMGAFQFAQRTWNYAAQLAGRPDLIGVAPNTTSVADQNSLAIALYSAVGEQPWYDPCRGG